MGVKGEENAFGKPLSSRLERPPNFGRNCGAKKDVSVFCIYKISKQYIEIACTIPPDAQ